MLRRSGCCGFLFICCFAVISPLNLKKSVSRFQLDVVNPFQRVVKQLSQSQQAALYAEVSRKMAVRGTYDASRGILAENITEMVLNVAYTLRHYKFNEYDRRYEHQWKENGRRPARSLFLAFPRPALSSLHSAVADHCWLSLYQCLWYLDRVARQTYTARRYDPLSQLQRRYHAPATVANVARWRAEKKNDFEYALRRHTWRCAQLHKMQSEAPDPFPSQVTRFRWLTTASYFMCWYTLHQMPELAYFSERCDNFADCMQSPDSTEVGNQDPRVRADAPFACALYSFCPEVCCPLRAVRSLEQCTDTPLNPCMPDNRPGERDCTIEAAASRNFDALITNYLNVSCRCPRGHRFSAYFRRCVDIDECFDGTDDCDRDSETCLNVRGSFDCVCRYGFTFNGSENACRPTGHARLRTAAVVAQLGAQAQNRSLSERLGQIEQDFRNRKFKAYFSWLPFNQAKVPTLGEAKEKFGQLTNKLKSHFKTLQRLLAGAGSGRKPLDQMMSLCVALAVSGGMWWRLLWQ